jgi:hypothetical protein
MPKKFKVYYRPPKVRTAIYQGIFEDETEEGARRKAIANYPAMVFEFTGALEIG